MIMDSEGEIFRHICTIVKFDSLLCHVRPSACMEQLGFHWMDIVKFDVVEYFLKICQENSSLIKIREE